MSFSENIPPYEIPDLAQPPPIVYGRILLVMEDHAEAERLREALAHVGSEVIVAHTSQAAEELLTADSPELLLLNVSAAQPERELLIRRMKTAETTLYLPILILLSEGCEPERWLEAGADDFLRHPLHLGEFVLRVKMLLRLSRLHQDLVDNNRELQAAYETARESEAKYRALIHDAQDALVLADPETSTILEANRRACELSGYENDDLLGQPVTMLCEKGTAGDWPLLLQEIMAQGRATVEQTLLLRKDGELVPIEIHGSLANHHLGKPLIQILTRDIRPRRQLEAERDKSERLSAVVETAVTVNHEINNPLLVITSSVEHLQRSLFDADSGVREKLERINEACGRIQRFTQQLASVIAPVTKEYLPGMKMLDIQQSISAADEDVR